MNIWPDTSIYISIGTILAVLGFCWKIASSITKAQEQIRELEERVSKIESLDLQTTLTEIKVDLKWIKENLDSKK